MAEQVTPDPHGEGRYVPVPTDAALEAALREGGLDLLPWAWFSLGWHGTTLGDWLALAGDRAMGGEELYRGVPLSVYYVRAAAGVLGDRIASGTRDRLLGCCKTVELHNDDLARERYGRSARHGSRFDTAEDAAGGLQDIVGGLARTGDADPWLEFGWRLGVVYSHKNLHNIPLADSLNCVLQACRDVSGLLADTVPQVGEAAGLVILDAAQAGRVAHRFRALVDPCWEWKWGDDFPDLFVASWLSDGMYRLSGRVSAALLDRQRRPEWVEADGAGELFFDGIVVRRVASLKRARNMVGVLRAFQEEEWPPRIDSPLKNDSQTLHNTLHQLNEGLVRIAFGADGTGEGICWTRVD